MDKKDRFKKAYEYLKYQDKVHSQKELATIMVASPTNVSSAMNGVESVLTDSFLERFNNAFSNIFDLDWLMSGSGEMLSCKNNILINKKVPLLPLDAIGGSLNDFVLSVRKYDCEQVVSPIGEIDFAITVCGDSMAPEYPNGSQIFIKKINEKAFIEWGNVYVLDTCNGVVIKKLIPSDKEGYVQCISINKEPIYAPFDVNWSDIYGVYRVLLCMARK